MVSAFLNVGPDEDFERPCETHMAFQDLHLDSHLNISTNTNAKDSTFHLSYGYLDSHGLLRSLHSTLSLPTQIYLGFYLTLSYCQPGLTWTFKVSTFNIIFTDTNLHLS